MLHTRQLTETCSGVAGRAESKLGDIDAVVLVAGDFERQVARGVDSAVELETMLLTRNPEEIFAAEDIHDWDDWVEFFSKTREPDGRGKGLASSGKLVS